MKTIIYIYIILYLLRHTLKLHTTFIMEYLRNNYNELGWKINDYILHDTGSIILYNKYKNTKKGFLLFGKNINLITNPNNAYNLLKNQLYNPTTKKFFETSLQINKIHPIIYHHLKYCNNILNTPLKQHFDFEDISTIFTSFLLFGETNIHKSNNIINKHQITEYINKPKEYTLLHYSLKNKQNIPNHQIQKHISHWINPIYKTLSYIFPIILCLLTNYNNIENKVRQENNITYFDPTKLIYTKKVILETLRLNNPVISLNKNNNIILTNGILRNKPFYKPNEFIPERWTNELENHKYNILFGAEQNKCPAQNFTINILQLFIYYFYKNIGNKYYNSNIHINKSHVPQSINPYKIIFSYSI